MKLHKTQHKYLKNFNRTLNGRYARIQSSQSLSYESNKRADTSEDNNADMCLENNLNSEQSFHK